MNNKNESEDTKGAAVKFPPPLVFLICLLGGFGINAIWPVGLIESAIMSYAGGTLVLLALIVLALLGFKFRQERVSIEPWKPTSKIMSTGLYAYSRNPIYLVFCIMVVGIGVTLNSFWIFISFVPAAFIVYHTAIAKEEKYLEQKFSEEYREYKSKVRRWL